MNKTHHTQLHDPAEWKKILEVIKPEKFPIPNDWKNILAPDFEQETDPLENTLTLIHITYTTSPKYFSGWWVNIIPGTFLINPVTCDKLELQAAVNIPYSPAKAYLKKRGDQLKFTLIFPAIPEDWNTFHMVEPGGNDTCLLEGFERNPSGVYHRSVY